MTTLAVPAPTPRQPRTAVLPPTAARLLTSEWIKLRTLRSTWWALALSIVLMVAMAMSRTASIAQVPEAAGLVEGSVYVTSGAALAQLVFCVLGVLAVTGEYATGQIRSSLAAAPTRVPVLWTKLAGASRPSW